MTLRLILAFSILAFTAVAEAQCRFDPLDRGRVVKISGAELPAALAMPLSDLSIMRVEKGRFVPVAYQFDEMDQKGMVWFEDSGFELAGSPGHLDVADQLLMMLTDAGPQAPATLRPAQGSIVADIAVARNCYFYLVEGNRQRSQNYYVAHDIDNGMTRTAPCAMPANNLVLVYRRD